MPAIHEVATLTLKGQITLPKSIRRRWAPIPAASLRSTCVGRSRRDRADAEHEDPAIAAFLTCWPATLKQAGMCVVCLRIWLAPLEHAGPQGGPGR